MKRLGRIGRTGMHRQDDQLAFRDELLDLPRCVEAVEQRHRDVEQDDVRFQPLSGLHQRAAVLDGADYLAVLLHEPAQAGEQDRMVVRQEHARLHGLS